MGAGSFDPKKKTVYLDQSTLSDIVRAGDSADQRANPAYATLDTWVEEIATTHNLCVSTAHLVEIARLTAYPLTAERLAARLESLPLVWVRSMLEIVPAETEFWLKTAAGRSAQPIFPFTVDIREAFARQGLRALPVSPLAPQSIYPFLDSARRLDFDQYADSMLAQAIAANADDDWVSYHGWSDARKREQLAYNLRVELRSIARTAIEGLNADASADDRLSHALADDFVALYAANLRSMPTFRMQEVIMRSITGSYRRREQQSLERKRKKLLGDFFDYHHMSVAAAYCDVVTCDGRIAAGIRETRLQLGFPPALSVKTEGGDLPFIAALRRAVS